VERGRLVRVRHGVYAFALLWNALPPWERYSAKVPAAMTYPDAVFALESAAALVGMPTFGDPWRIGAGTMRPTSHRAILRGAGVHAVRPEDAAQLFSLKRALSTRAPHPVAAAPSFSA